jgi:hypothetical protein
MNATQAEQFTQAEQDLIENGDFGEPGLFAPRIYSQHEPSTKCCGLPYLKVSRDYFQCLGCAMRYEGEALRRQGIDTNTIG